MRCLFLLRPLALAILLLIGAQFDLRGVGIRPGRDETTPIFGGKISLPIFDRCFARFRFKVVEGGVWGPQTSIASELELVTEVNIVVVVWKELAESANFIESCSSHRDTSPRQSGSLSVDPKRHSVTVL